MWVCVFQRRICLDCGPIFTHHLHTHTHTHTHVHAVHTHANTHTHTRTHMNMHTHTHAHAHTHTRIHTHTHTHFCGHTRWSDRDLRLRSKRSSATCLPLEVARYLHAWKSEWVRVGAWERVRKRNQGSSASYLSLIVAQYGVVTISRLLKSIGLFCRTSSLWQGSFAKETYNLKEPTSRSYPISTCIKVWVNERVCVRKSERTESRIISTMLVT